jgi:hypothetical protein
MTIDYQTFMMLGFILVQAIGFGKYLSNVNTRVAVLEASHNTMTDDLKEIKEDVKELLRSMTS